MMILVQARAAFGFGAVWRILEQVFFWGTNPEVSLGQEAEWMTYFREQKEKAQALKSEVAKTDREIDQLVYALYGLTEEEIRIVEEATG